MNNRVVRLLALLVAAIIVASGCSSAKQGSTGSGQRAGEESVPTVVMYKSPTCGCCTKWADHLSANGFKVEVRTADNINAVKDRYGVPPRLRSCHTAIVDGYVVEGHVPAREVKRLLEERPDVAGIAVPGMPIGSPGMEVPGAEPQPFNVVAFDKSGNTRVVAQYPQ